MTAPSSSRRGGRKLLGKLAAVAMGVAVPLLLLEAVVRTFAVDPGMFAWGSPGTCVDHSALLGEEFRPRCLGRLADTDFRTNSLGLRGAEVADDAGHRILAIGDSCTWGWGVSEDQSYPGVLNQLLGQWGYTVINAGVPGYTSHQGLVYFRERGVLLHPEVVVIGFGFNDAIEDGAVVERIARERRMLPVLRLDETLARYSIFYRWLRHQTYRPPVTDRTVRVTVEEYERNLTDLVHLVQEAHARAVLLDFVGPEFPYGVAASAVADRLGIPLVRYRGPRLDIVHPTAEGYDTLAHMVLLRLLQEDYL